MCGYKMLSELLQAGRMMLPAPESSPMSPQTTFVTSLSPCFAFNLPGYRASCAQFNDQLVHSLIIFHSRLELEPQNPSNALLAGVCASLQKGRASS